MTTHGSSENSIRNMITRAYRKAKAQTKHHLIRRKSAREMNPEAYNKVIEDNKRLGITGTAWMSMEKVSKKRFLRRHQTTAKSNASITLPKLNLPE